jgi:cobalamin biosynthetic protein CobC
MPRDHGGGIDAAAVQFGGSRDAWLDLSTGINPQPYPLPAFSNDDWAALPDSATFDALNAAASEFCKVPAGADILPAHGASAVISRAPALASPGRVLIQGPTYNEHAASFVAHGWHVADSQDAAAHPDARVLVHPNNPDGRLWQAHDATAPLTIIDESFCDVTPDKSLVHLADQPGVIVLKSFGKFWGLAGLRLGFAIAQPSTIHRLGALCGPWAVSGPALRVGALALQDTKWANQTRDRLQADATRLDQIMTANGAKLQGGTSLFRLYQVDNAQRWQSRLARNHVWSRIFPYSDTLIRLGLPAQNRWSQLTEALS